MRLISKFILKLLGWKTTKDMPVEDKCIILAAPHTSMFDFLFGWLFYKSIGGKPFVMVKQELFFFPLGILIRWMGGIPVDRKPGNRMIEKMAQEFKNRKQLHLAIAPEGTRSKVKQWKKGFLLIARRAEVPVYLGYADYKKKEVGIKGVFIPSDNSEEDIRNIRLQYKGITPRHPEKFADYDTH